MTRAGRRGSETERRRALSLNCADALMLTRPLTARRRVAVIRVLRRLSRSEGVTAEEESYLISLLQEAGCVLTPPFEETALGSRVS